MSESNITLSAQTHQIFISSLRPMADRTGVYITLLLFSLLFILIIYLVYNFISYKRHSSLLKPNKKTSYLYPQIQRNTCLSTQLDHLNQSINQTQNSKITN